MPPLLEELQGPLRKATLSACADQSAVGEHIVLDSILLHLLEELQALSGILLFPHALVRALYVIILGWGSSFRSLSMSCKALSGTIPSPHALIKTL